MASDLNSIDAVDQKPISTAHNGWIRGVKNPEKFLYNFWFNNINSLNLKGKVF